MASVRAVARDPASRPSRRLESTLGAALWFAAPFLALLAAWTLAVRGLEVPLRVFPAPGDVVVAFRQQLATGALLTHVWESLRRVLVGGTLAVATSVPLGIAISTNRAVAGFFAPILRFFSVLAGIAWIPLATLWFGYGFGAVTFIIFGAGQMGRQQSGQPVAGILQQFRGVSGGDPSAGCSEFV